MDKKVSIIIPHYNHNDVLLRAVASATKQGKDAEIIVVDDFSEENPFALLDYDEVKFPVRYLRHLNNRGLAATRNTGIKAAKGEWILPLDADDELCEGVVNQLLEQAPGADVVYGNVIYHGVRMEPNKDIKLDDFKTNNQLYATSMFKKSAWEKAGGYWEGPREFYEDWEFWIRMMKSGAKFKYADVDVYKYHGGAMCKRLEDKKEEVVKMLLEHAFGE